MTRETRLSIGIVAVVVLVVLLGIWLFSGTSHLVESEPPIINEPASGAPSMTVEPVAQGEPESGVSAGENITSGTEAVEQPNLAAGSGGAITTEESAQATADQETFRIIVREPVTVDGVDVGQVLKDKVITNEDEIVNKAIE